MNSKNASRDDEAAVLLSKGKMRAVVIDRFGGPEVLSVRTLPIPRVNPDGLLVRVKSAGVGAWDVIERQGILAQMFNRAYGVKSSFPYVIGSEGAGEVTEVGENVKGIRVGDLVCADVWARDPKGGFYAEYTAVEAEQTMPIPSNLTVEQAGPLLIDGVVAVRGLDEALEVKRDEKVMIIGASGGIGHLAIQLAKRMRAQVFAVASREDGVAMARRLGADAVVEGHDGDAVAAAARAFAPSGFDAALVAVRGSVPAALKATEDALTAMREGSRVAYPWSNNVMPPPRAPPNVRLLPFNSVDELGKIPRESMTKLNSLIEAGPFEVHLGKSFPLDRVAEAHSALASHYVGRLALLPHPRAPM